MQIKDIALSLPTLESMPRATRARTAEGAQPPRQTDPAFVSAGMGGSNIRPHLAPTGEVTELPPLAVRTSARRVFFGNAPPKPWCTSRNFPPRPA